jgi:hypothetical protein
MSVEFFQQEIWAKQILDDLKAECKLVAHCTTDYEGDCKFAKSVRILGVGTPTIRKYDGTAITVEPMSDKSQELPIDQQYYFAFHVDDVDEAQSMPGLMEAYREESVYGLALQRDTHIANLIKSCTRNVTDAENVTQEGVKAAVDKGIVALRNRHFREKGYIELSPAAANAFKNCLVTLSTNNPDYIKRGIIGMYDGFEVTMSDNLAKDAQYEYCAIRGKKAIAFAGQLNKVEALRDQTVFKDLVRGLDDFGAKVIDENRIQVLRIPVVAAG